MQRQLQRQLRMKINVLVWVQTQQCCGLKIVSEILYIYSPKKETQHVKKYNFHQYRRQVIYFKAPPFLAHLAWQWVV
jgi:hypothetical protein